MKRSIPMLIVFVVLSTDAAAEKDKMDGYLQLDAGHARFADSEIDGRDVTFDDGWSINGRWGGESGRLAGELEIGLHGANSSPVGDGYNPSHFMTVGFNLFYKFLKLSGLEAYAGAGLDLWADEPKINIFQSQAHVETGLILRPSKHVQLVPHVRAMAALGTWEDDIGRSETYVQYISTVRLGVRFTPQFYH